MAERKMIYLDDAIEAIFSEPLYESGMKKRDADAVVPAIYEKIKSLSSVQPEHKTGRWEPFNVPWYRCSECGAVRENIAFMENFCPNCGADMRGEKDE